jgi:hypothetical protein
MGLIQKDLSDSKICILKFRGTAEQVNYSELLRVHQLQSLKVTVYLIQRLYCIEPDFGFSASIK